MEKKEILQQLINYYTEGNKSRFAELIEVTPQTVSSWISRNTFDLDRVYSKCVGLSAHWLLTGEGDMMISDKALVKKQTDDMTNANVINIPVLNLDSRGGFLSNDVVEPEYVINYIPFSRSTAQQGDVVINVFGDSMSPKFPNGSLILIRKVELWREFLELNNPYVIDIKDGRRLLKVVRRADDTTQYMLCSYNPAYEPQPIPKTIIRGIYRVLMTVRQEGV